MGDSDDDLPARGIRAAAGLLLNGQPFSALFNLVLIVFCAILGLIFHVLLLVPSAHAVISVHLKRDQRMHREVVEAIRRHGVPPG